MICLATRGVTAFKKKKKSIKCHFQLASPLSDLQQCFSKSKNLLAQSLVRQLFERKASGKNADF